MHDKQLGDLSPAYVSHIPYLHRYATTYLTCIENLDLVLFNLYAIHRWSFLYCIANTNNFFIRIIMFKFQFLCLDLN